MPAESPKGILGKKLLEFFSFEPGEVRPTLLLTAYLLLAISSMVALKATRDSLFLAEFTADHLPYVYVATAALMGFVVSFYLKLSARLPQTRLLIYTQLFFASHLVLFWWLLRQNLPWLRLPAVIYVWSEVYAVIIPMQVWILANHIFTTRQARRLFNFIGSGGILGGALGGLFSNLLARPIGTRGLLLTHALFLLACPVLVAYLSGSTRGLASSSSPAGKHPASAGLSQSWRTIRGSRYLSLIGLLVVLSAVVNTLVDYQFKYIVETWHLVPDEMTAFFGSFNSSLAVLSFLMHLVLTSRIMRWFGLNFAIFVLPLSMLLGSSVLLFSTALWAGMLIKGFDGGFRHSIDRSSTELLYVPLPLRVKQQAKSFIDMIAGRTAVGLAAGLLFLLTSVWNFSVEEISWVNLAVVVPWLGVAWLLRREYVNTLRSSIERKDISAEALLGTLAGASPSEELTASLASSDEQAVEAGLGWLQYAQFNVAYAHLASLLVHGSPTIRRKAMAMVASKDVPGCAEKVVQFLHLDDQVESLWQALEYLQRHDPGESYFRFKDLLEAPQPILRGTAAARLLAMAHPVHRAKALEALTGFVESARCGETAFRQPAAELLGRVPPDLECQAALADFLSDSDPQVVRAAAIGAGRTRRQDLLQRLVELSGDRLLKTEARRALASFGADILAILHQSLQDNRLPLKSRLNLPRVFSSIGGQQAADYLVISLDQKDPALAYEVLRALSRIRLKQPEVRPNPSVISPLVEGEIRHYYQYLSFLQGVPQDGLAAGTKLLRRALSEQIKRRLENIFRLIGLLYPTREILDAYYGISSGRRDLRANAVEFLDSVLLNPVRQMLLPAIEGRPLDRILEFARTQLSIEAPNYPETLRALVAERDPWLKSCAIYAAADQGLVWMEPLLEPLVDASDVVLQETARAARQRLRAAQSPPAAPLANPPLSPSPSPGMPWKT